MHIFVYEYTCAAEESADHGSALHAEGWAMLQAVREDFARIPGVTVQTLLAHESAEPEEVAFRRLASVADYTLVIAPECDDLLHTRCCWVEEASGRLLGPSPEAVHLTGDKLQLGQHLQRAGVPTPPCQPWSARPSRAAFPVVCKPRDGAGSQATFLVRDAGELAACAERAHAEGWVGELIVQPFVPGQPASMAFLLGPSRCLPLAPATQELSSDGRFHYQGGVVPLSPGLAERAVRLARRAVESVPGLLGYVGVDLVLGEADDGSADMVIEINPRLTTSYVGLRALAEGNLAEAMLRVVRGEEVPALTWRQGTVHFRADGTVISSSSAAARCEPASPG